MGQYQLIRATAFGVALLGAGMIGACSSQETATALPASTTDQTSTNGTVTFTSDAVALGVGYQWGSGNLSYRGTQYPFRIRGLSIVDVGASRATGTARVRNLRSLADFNGNYVSASAGATAAGGVAASALRNQNGVVIEGISTSQGLRLTLAPGGVNIELE